MNTSHESLLAKNRKSSSEQQQQQQHQVIGSSYRKELQEAGVPLDLIFAIDAYSSSAPQLVCGLIEYAKNRSDFENNLQSLVVNLKQELERQRGHYLREVDAIEARTRSDVANERNKISTELERARVEFESRRQAEINSLQTQLKDSREKHVVLLEAVARLENELQVQQAANKQLKDQFDATSTQISNSQNQLSESATQIASKDLILFDQENRIMSLESHNRELNAQLDAAKRLKSENTNLMARLEENGNTISQLRNQVENLDGEIGSLKVVNASLANKVNLATMERMENDVKMLADAKSRLNQLEKDLSAEKEARGKDADHYAKKLEEWLSMSRRLEENCRQLADGKSAVEARESKLNDENSRLKAALDRMGKELAQRMRSATTSAPTPDQPPQATPPQPQQVASESCSVVCITCKETRQALIEKDEELVQVRAELDNAVEKFKQTVDEKEAEIAKLGQKNEELQSLLDTERRTRSMKSALYADSLGQIARQDSKIEGLEKQVYELESQVDSLEGTMESHKKSYGRKQAQIASLQQTIRHRDNQCANYRRQLQKMTGEFHGRRDVRGRGRGGGFRGRGGGGQNRGRYNQHWSYRGNNNNNNRNNQNYERNNNWNEGDDHYDHDDDQMMEDDDDDYHPTSESQNISGGGGGWFPFSNKSN